MKISELGFERAPDGSWPHKQKDLTELEAWCLDTIRTWGQRRGSPNIPADALANFVGVSDRDLRDLINHLIDRQYHGLPVYMLPGGGGGYFLAENEVLKERARISIGAQLSRAKTSATKARDMGATAQELAEGVLQLTLDLGDEVRGQLASALASDRKKPATHRDVVKQLRRYAKDPVGFARQIQELRDQFGALFVRREELARVLRKHQEEVLTRSLDELAKGETV